MVLAQFRMDFVGERFSSNASQSFSLHEKSTFGEKVGEKIQYSFCEALFLLDKKKAHVFFKSKSLLFDDLLKKLQRLDKRISLKYSVFKDLREKGYVVKTALKFGADFRIYEKGKKPGKAHAKWIVFVDHESKAFTWQAFSSKNRVAHSTKKQLLLAIVDEEHDVLYYKVDWIKP